MNKTVQAVYADGAFRPLEPVPFQEQERVFLTVENARTDEDILLDNEFLSYCESQADDSVSLEDVRNALAKIPGCRANKIRLDRDQG
jgi:predicted DNA-binding antitoxin AbrB/MazE fold protein